MNIKQKAAVLTAIVTTLNGCTTFSSTPVDQSHSAPTGLLYFLPRRDIIVEVTVVDKNAQANKSEKTTTDSTLKQNKGNSSTNTATANKTSDKKK